MPAKRISTEEIFPFRYSICTLVTKPPEYSKMLETFLQAGFVEDDCEYLYCDNSNGNEFDAFAGINRFLREAKGELVIICHQDVFITIDHREKLEEQIEQVTLIDSKWAVLGNAGINNLYNTSMIITESDQRCYRSGILPSKVQSLDENFLLVKASANLAVTGDLKGFHMYGTDICMVAECLGYSAFAIDFHLVHKSSGLVDESFHQLALSFYAKYSFFFRGRYIRTTITRSYVSANSLVNSFMNLGIVKNSVRLYYKLRFMTTKQV